MTDQSIFPEKSYLFIPDADDAFLPAKVLTTFKRGEKGSVEICEVPSTDKDQKKRTKNTALNPEQSKGCLPMDPESLQGMQNMVALKQLNDASILHNLRIRFFANEIYTGIGTILVSVNPFKILPLYTPKVLEGFVEKGSAKNPPHVCCFY